VSAQGLTILVFLLLIVTLILVAFYVPRFMMRRAVRHVVSMFRKLGATSPTTGTTPEELGLVPGNPFDRLFRPRDYRPSALLMLKQANIIRTTEEGTLYLSEDELGRSPLKALAKIK
jgi:hypothetical protein